MRAKQRIGQRGPVDDGAGFRATPELVRLEPDRSGRGRTKPPVRIYLGTEDAQWRAERVFFYSIDRVRDRSRAYEIYLLKNLRGFARGSWRTGFTMYRFAIPDYAGRTCRAIYNDVDQIYLADPAELFDLDLGTHAYRAVSADDTSVMLLDCERMARWWNLEAARTADKAELLAGPAAEPGLWGSLDAGWNARDLEYLAGGAKCVHFTTLHIQPWQPTPEQYSYHEHPLAELWHGLERAADAEGYRVFTRERPSARFGELIAQHAERRGQRSEAPPFAGGSELMATTEPRTVLHVTLAGPRSQIPGATGVVHDLASADAWPRGDVDLVVASRLLERLPADDVGWVLDELFARAERAVLLAVSSVHDEDLLPDGSSTVQCVRPSDWWRAQVALASRKHPRVAWQLEVCGPGSNGNRTVEVFRTKAVIADTAPRVWVLHGVKTGDNRQLMELAEALGWPYEVKQLTFNSLRHAPNVLLGATLATIEARSKRALVGPPWPDVVLSSGKRAVPVARWIQSRSKGKARLVHLGRPWAPLEWFDLIITTPQYRLPARPNILHTTMPLNRLTPVREARARENAEVVRAIERLPRPRTAVLVGGNSTSLVLTADAAQRLGCEASAAASADGGSLLVTTSPRTPATATAALRSAIECPVYFHDWNDSALPNPYDAFLALADAFIVTGDSASMLAEACSTGRSVSIFALPSRWLLRAPSSLTRIVRRRRVSYRGTPRQQGLLGRFYDRLVENGLLTPARDLSSYHFALTCRGLAAPLGAPRTEQPVPYAGDLERAVEGVVALLARDERISA